jgi:hypothetical protein
VLEVQGEFDNLHERAADVGGRWTIGTHLDRVDKVKVGQVQVALVRKAGGWGLEQTFLVTARATPWYREQIGSLNDVRGATVIFGQV